MSLPSTLLNEVLTWFSMNQYRRASFERLVGIIPSAGNFDQLNELVATHPDIFRACTISGGRPGLALLDHPVNLQMAVPVAADAPRVTEEDITAEIMGEYFFTAADAVHSIDNDYGHPTQVLPRSMDVLTICVLVLKNGYTIVGKSSCVSPANYNEEIGRRIARENAVNQVWNLLGFRLADKLFSAG